MQDINRRTLLGGAAALGFGAVATLPASAEAGTRPRWGSVPKSAISIQLYTLRSILATDLEGTLAKLAAIGYRKVELAGLHGRTPAEFRAILNRVGLRATSSHVGLGADWAKTFDEAHVLGQRYVVVPFAAFTTADEWKKLADDLNTAGRAASKTGLRFGYHNHAHEFKALPTGEVPFDILTSRTDRRHVHFEVDLYWTVTGGRDPVRVIRANRHRILQFHVKDRAADGSFADLGKGTIDFPRIFSHADEAGVQEFIVEHDQPPAPLSTARIGYDYLRKVRFACR